ncbi:MAG: hypothetical protein FJ149_06825 [Euryarchaeota archaeon]|nr:hypothetical protein [Euryarchaeota archaeon]
MKAESTLAALVVLVLSAPAFAPAAEPPVITLDNPRPGVVLLNGTVEVNGTARGSSIDWQEALQEDFALGTPTNLTNDASGTLSLDRSMYDTFDGSAIDPGRWEVSTAPDIAASVGGGKLLLSGSAQSDGWTSHARLLSTSRASGTVNGTLSQFNDVGTGAYSAIGLYQNDQNYVMLGRGFDFFGMGPGQRIVVLSCVSGCFTMESLGAITNTPHTFVVSHDGNQAALHMDGSQLATRSIALSNAVCIIKAATNASGDWISAAWDDISCLYLTSGRFESAPYDTLSGAPGVRQVAWTANVPGGTTLAVRLRSAGNGAMDGASAWTAVISGQSSGFPAFQRYMQYEVLFSSPAGNGTPLFRDITVKYICAIKKVEVSMDNRATWTAATGGESWTVTLQMPDGPRTIWARVTDVSGDVQVASVSLDIDTTAPLASLQINNGAALTPRPEVNLSLFASDDYDVWAMMLSEDPLFGGAEWQAFRKSVTWNLSAGEGEKSIHFKVRDQNGWESAVAVATITLDTLPPKGTIRINEGAPYTRTTSVKLALNATDALGVTEMAVSNRMDISDTDWLPYTPAFPWDLQPGNGLRKVYARFRDAAGHISAVTSASITLDTVPPEFTFAIENGSAFVRSLAVELQVNATDNYELGQLMVSSQPQFAGAVWQQWEPAVLWTLPAGEGPASLYAKVRDVAGNEAPPQAASTVVDTVAPQCIVSSLPATVTQESFSVSWNGNDATSGITGYDIQYRDGTGPWMDWLSGFSNTSAVFTGQDGHTYTFRARAHDLAGNVGAYPDNPRTTTTVRLPGGGGQAPLVSISTPASGAPLKGKAVFDGTARALAPGRTVELVQWQVDDGPWRDATGTGNWSFEWDTTKASRGTHILRVRSFDGVNHSLPAERTVVVDNPATAGTGGGGDLLPVLLALVAVVAAGSVGGVLVMMRRKRAAGAPAAPTTPPGPGRGEPGELAKPAQPAEGSEGAGGEGRPEGPATGEGVPGEQAAPEGGPATAEPVPPGEGEAAEAAPVGEPAGAPSALPQLHPTARPPLELVRQVDPEKIRPVVQALLPTLPGELQFMQPEVLTQLVVTGEQGKTKFGEAIVLIMGRWYFADENKPHFLQRYNW